MSNLWAIDWSCSQLIVFEWPGCRSILLCWFPLSRVRTSISLLNFTLLFASLAFCLIRLIFFGGCLRHSLHQIVQQFAFHCPGRWINCSGCSPIKVKENFTPPSSFQRFQIFPDILFLQLTFLNRIIRYTVDDRCTTWYWISLDN